MNRIILIITASLFSMASVFGQSPLSDAVKSNIQSRIENGDIKGIAIAVIKGDQIDYFEEGVQSVESKAEIKANTIFEIGSISKTYTGLMLADLVIQGKVRLDDELQKYLPDGIKSPAKDDKQITLRHLANHTSGLPRMPSNFAPADMNNPFSDYSEKLMFDFLNSHDLLRAPGISYEYSNYAMGLLGHIVSEQYGLTYEAALIEKIAVPLGMLNTTTTGGGVILSDGHMGNNVAPHWDFMTLGGAGAIRSNAVDMMTYLSANMGLKKSDLYPAMQLAHKNSGAADSNPIVGLGWHTMKVEDQEIIWHNGATGGFTSFMGWIKGTKHGVVVLNNSTENVDDIGIHILASSQPLKEVKKTVDVDESILESYVGKYAIAPTFLLTVTKDGKQLSVQATGQGNFEIYPKSETEFYYKVVEAELVFKNGEDGVVESVTLLQAGQRIEGKKIE